MFQATAVRIAEDYRIEKLEILREWHHNELISCWHVEVLSELLANNKRIIFVEAGVGVLIKVNILHLYVGHFKSSTNCMFSL
jgi:hypothetical protein